MCIYTVGSLWGAWTSVLIIEVSTFYVEELQYIHTATMNITMLLNMVTKQLYIYRQHNVIT